MATLTSLLFLCCIATSDGQTHSPDWLHNISTNLFHLPGDVMLGGLFDINSQVATLVTEPDSFNCSSLNELGLGLSLVMKFAVDQINGEQRLLPGLRLGYHIYDTCRQSAVVVKPTISFLTERSTGILTARCNYTDYVTRVAAVIGPYTSEMVSVIGKLLGFFLMPQISYGATSDKFSDKSLYPSFFRTVPSDKWQVEGMAKLLLNFSWNWVAVVGSEEEYGQRGIQEFSKMADRMSVCVAYQGFIPVYDDPYNAILSIIHHIKNANVSVVIVFSLVEPARLFFKEVIKSELRSVWIASTSWATSGHITSLPGIQNVGTILAFTDRLKRVDFLDDYILYLFNKISQEGAGPLPVPEPHELPNPCPQCWTLSATNMSLMQNPTLQLTAFSVYAAVYSVATALHDLLRCDDRGCARGADIDIYPWELLQILKNVSVDLGLDGTLRFDHEGNPNIGYNLIEWVWNGSRVEFLNVGKFEDFLLTINLSLFTWHTPNSEVPQSICSADCGSGQVRRVKGFHSCCFDCIDCLPGTFQKYLVAMQCTPCPEGQWSEARSVHCTDPVFDVLSWDQPETQLLVLAGLLLLLCQAAISVVFARHRQSALVQASGGTLSLVVVWSLMGANLSLLLFLGQPNDTVCRLQLPFTSSFQTVALAIITSISLQILYISEFPKHAASKISSLRGPASILFIGSCCAIQSAILAWFLYELPTLSAHVASLKIDFVHSFLVCPVSPLSGFALMQGFNAALALVSFMCTFMAAKPQRQYNLARDITFGCLVYCVIWVTFIPVYIGLHDKLKSVVHVSFVLVSDFGLLAMYYFPKCHLIFSRPELNTAEHFCTFLEGIPAAPQQEAEPGTQSESPQ